MIWGSTVIWGSTTILNETAWGSTVIWGSNVTWGARSSGAAIWYGPTLRRGLILVIWGSDSIGQDNGNSVIWGARSGSPSPRRPERRVRILDQCDQPVVLPFVQAESWSLTRGARSFGSSMLPASVRHALVRTPPCSRSSANLRGSSLCRIAAVTRSMAYSSRTNCTTLRGG